MKIPAAAAASAAASAAAAAASVGDSTQPPVAGLAFVCVPKEDTVAVSPQGAPLLQQQQHQQQQQQQCCGRSRLLLRLLQKANWAAVPIFIEQVRSNEIICIRLISLYIRR